MAKYNIWDILAKIALAIIIIYFLLKAVGVLHSPVFADILTILSAGYFVGRYSTKIDKIDDIEKDIESLRRKCPVIRK